MKSYSERKRRKPTQVGSSETASRKMPDTQPFSKRAEVVAQRELSKALNKKAGEPRSAAQSPATKKGEGQSGLPEGLKTGVESLSGVAMDDVKVHLNSSRPAQLSALAYAQGSDIHVAPGQEKHLPHEAWHVAQQKQGRVKPTAQLRGTNINNDSRLEQEADAMGAKAANAQAAQRQAPRSKAGSLGTGTAQRTVKIKGVEESDVDKLMLEMTKAVIAKKDTDTQGKLISLHPFIVRKLKQWVQEPRKGSVKAQFRFYDSYYELALAVVGQVESTDNRVIEKRLAIQTAGSPYIKSQLRSVCTKILLKIIKNKALVDLMLKDEHGKYGKYFRQEPTLELLSEAAMGSRISFPKMIVAIHDVTDRDIVRGQLLTKDFENEARTNTARKELAPDTLEARKNKAPVEAGLSHTTNRMLALGSWAGAEGAELEAIAWGIFAYWKILYDKTFTGKHTFDEVMAVAKMYGVPYVRYHYPSGPPPDAWSKGPLVAAKDAPSIPQKLAPKSPRTSVVPPGYTGKAKL